MKAIKEIFCNSRFDHHEAGKGGVKSIEYHPWAGKGDRHYCTVHDEDGTEARIYDLDEIVWGPENERR